MIRVSLTIRHFKHLFLYLLISHFYTLFGKKSVQFSYPFFHRIMSFFYIVELYKF